MDMVVQRHDGPCWLCDDDDDDVVPELLEYKMPLKQNNLVMVCHHKNALWFNYMLR